MDSGMGRDRLQEGEGRKDTEVDAQVSDAVSQGVTRRPSLCQVVSC